jgi:WD40 repeat protein
VDEIDAVRSLPFSADEFFAAIRECYTRRAEDPAFQRLTFCLLGVATPSDLIQDVRMTPFNIGRRIELTDFTAAEATPLAFGLSYRGERGERAERREREEASEGNEGARLLERILYWTGGHPYLTQRLARAVAEAHPVTPSPLHPLTPSAEVDRQCEALFLSPSAREKDDNLLFVRERLLRSEADLASVLDLYGKVRAGRCVPVDDTNQLVDILRLSGITRVTESGPPTPHTLHPTPSLSVRNRIYAHVFDRDWVRQHMPDAEVRRQRAAFRRGVARTTAVAGVLIAIMGGLALWALDREQQARDAVAQQRIATTRMERARDRAEGERLTAQRLLYISDMNVAHQDWQTANIGRMTELLDAHRPLPGEEDHRGFEWYYLWRLCHADLFTLRGHSARVGCVTFSADGTRLATGSVDGTVRLWDAATGRAIQTLPGHRGTTRVTFAPTGNTLTAWSEEDKTVRVWDLRAGRVARAFTFPDESSVLLGAPLSPDGNTMAMRRDPETLAIWGVREGRVLRTFPAGRTATVAFSPDGARLAVGSGGEDRVSLWEVKTGREIGVLNTGQGETAISLAFSSDGSRLASGSYGGTVKVWDIRTRRELRTLEGHSNRVWSMAFSADGGRLATGGRDSTARIWNAVDGRETHVFRGHGSEVFSVAFSPSGKRLATASSDGTVKVWDAVRTPRTPTLPVSGGIVAFAPDNKTLAIRGDGSSARLWDTSTRRETRALRGHTATVEMASFSHDGKSVATASADETVKLWNVADGHETRTVRGHTDRVLAAAFSPDGKTLVTGSADKTVRLWIVATGRQVWTHDTSPARVFAVALSPDGRTVVVGQGRVGGRGTIRLLDAATGRPTRALTEHTGTVSAVATSPDGRLLAAASWDTDGSLWDLATGERIQRLKHPMPVTWVTFSPDGRRLATGCGDGTVKLWDVATGRELLTLRGLTFDVWVAFSPDGRRLAAASGEAVMLWEAASKADVAARDARERVAAAPRE